MKVYVVEYGYYDHHNIEEIFNSRLLAERYINFHPKGKEYSAHLEVEEHDVLVELPE